MRVRLAFPLFLGVALSGLARPVWPQCQTATLAPGAGQVGGELATSVSVSGTTAVAGSPGTDGSGMDSGAVHVFEDPGTGWTETAVLVASDGAGDARFGASVVLAGDVLFVGAPGGDGAVADSGAVYVFERMGGLWMEVQKLVAANGEALDAFGTALALSGATALVGAPLGDGAAADSGAVYVFELQPAGWVQTAVLTAGDGDAGDRFGGSVSLSGDTAWIGASLDDVDGPGGPPPVLIDAGSAYAFERTGGVWSEDAKLVPAGASAFDRFGTSVSVSGETALVGASFGEGEVPNSGAAHVFERVASVWTEAAVLAPGVYRRNTLCAPPPQGIWIEVPQLVPCGAASGDQTGRAVAISGDTVVLGAPRDDGAAADGGAAYVYSFPVPQLSRTFLAGDVAELSLGGGGGTQSFCLTSYPPLPGGCLYFLLGTTSGTSPGVPVDQAVLPLNPDAYTDLTLIFPNLPPLLKNTLGTLTVEGQGSAKVSLPGTAALVGTVLHHAYLAFDVSQFGLVTFASNPVALTLLP